MGRPFSEALACPPLGLNYPQVLGMLAALAEGSVAWLWGQTHVDSAQALCPTGCASHSPYPNLLSVVSSFEQGGQ